VEKGVEKLPSTLNLQAKIKFSTKNRHSNAIKQNLDWFYFSAGCGHHFQAGNLRFSRGGKGS
jgi:hypothetical protein